MRKLAINTVLALVSIACYAQERTLPKVDLFEDTRYTMNTTIVSEFEYKLEFENTESKKKYVSILRPFTEAKFRNEFIRITKDSLLVFPELPKAVREARIDEGVRTVYFNIIYGAQIPQDENRYAGELGIKRKNLEVFSLNFLNYSLIVTGTGANKVYILAADKIEKNEFKRMRIKDFQKLTSDSLERLNLITSKPFNVSQLEVSNCQKALDDHYAVLDENWRSVETIDKDINRLELSLIDLNKKLVIRNEEKKTLTMSILDSAFQHRDIKYFDFNELKVALDSNNSSKSIKNWKDNYRDKVIKPIQIQLEKDGGELTAKLSKQKKIAGDLKKNREALKKPISQIALDSIQLKLFKDSLDIANKIGELNASMAQNKRLIQRLERLNSSLSTKELNLEKINYDIILWESRIKAEGEEIEGKLKDRKTKIDSIKPLELKKNRLESELREAFKNLKVQEELIVKRNFEFDFAEFEIKDGFLENIMVVGKLSEVILKEKKYEYPANQKRPDEIRLSFGKGYYNILKFRQSTPIGFTRRIDFDALKYRHIYALDKYGRWYAISLGDLFDNEYIEKLSVGRRDFSPKNQVVRFEKIGDDYQKLMKEPKSDILTAVVYSDLSGLNEQSPNGLIQTEFLRRQNLLTERITIKSLNVPRLIRESNIPRFSSLGTLSYIDAGVTFSKIEDENKVLPLSKNDKIVNGQLSPQSFATTLDLRQHESISSEFGLNLFTYDKQNGMTTITIDWLGRYATTKVQDSTRSLVDGIIQSQWVEPFPVTTFSYGPKFNARIQGDESYFFNFSFTHHWLFLRDDSFIQVANERDFLSNNAIRDKIRNEYNQVEITAGLNSGTENKGKIFFRYRLFWQQGFWNTTFHQAQIGYSFSVLKNNAY